MSDSRVEVDGAAELAAAAARVPDACERAAADAGEKVAAALVTSTRGITPKRSGRLASSITREKVPDGWVVSFGAGVPYAGWIEYGGTHGRPYVPDGRYLGAGAEDAATRYQKNTQANLDDELRRLDWP
jgi:phage gpG-like protein